MSFAAATPTWYLASQTRVDGDGPFVRWPAGEDGPASPATFGRVDFREGASDSAVYVI